MLLWLSMQHGLHEVFTKTPAPAACVVVEAPQFDTHMTACTTSWLVYVAVQLCLERCYSS